MCQTQPSVNVDDPQEEGGWGQKFYTYNVSYDSFENPVGSGASRHRYSDFEKLQATLRNRYQSHGILVPSLPKKNVVVKGKAFVLQRMRGLTMFCQCVAGNPYLRNDDAWTAFLAGNPSFATQNSTVLPPCPPRWEQAVNAFTTPSNSGEMLANFKVESGLVENTLMNLVSKANKLVAAAGALSSATSELGQLTSDFSDAETNQVDHLNTLAADDDSSSSVPNVLSRVANLFIAQAPALESLPDVLSVLLVESLEYESMQMYDFSNMVKHVDKLVSDNDKFEKAQFALERKNTTKFTEDKMKKHEEAIEEAGKILEVGRAHLDFYIRSICMVTLPQIAKERKVRMRNIFMLFAATMKSITNGAQAGLDEFFANNGADFAEWNSNADDILTKLNLAPLPGSNVPPTPPPQAA